MAVVVTGLTVVEFMMVRTWMRKVLAVLSLTDVRFVSTGLVGEGFKSDELTGKYGAPAKRKGGEKVLNTRTLSVTYFFYATNSMAVAMTSLN